MNYLYSPSQLESQFPRSFIVPSALLTIEHHRSRAPSRVHVAYVFPLCLNGKIHFFFPLLAEQSKEKYILHFLLLYISQLWKFSHISNRGAQLIFPTWLFTWNQFIFGWNSEGIMRRSNCSAPSPQAAPRSVEKCLW